MHEFMAMGRISTDTRHAEASKPTLALIEACKPFVFDHRGLDLYDRWSPSDVLRVVPFPVFSLEIPVVFSEDGTLEPHSLLVGTQSYFEWAREQYPDNLAPPDVVEELCYLGVSCILVNTQVSAQLPDLYVMYKRMTMAAMTHPKDEFFAADPYLYSTSLVTASGVTNGSVHKPTDDSAIDGYRSMLGAVNKFLEMTEVERTLKRPTKNAAIKYRNPKNRKKKLKIVKPVVFVVGKCFKKEPGDGSTIVAWTHQWRSRGHWRKLKGIGKNTDGIYCERDRTWVVDCIKGPEEKELIEKQHVVKDVS